MKPPLWLRGLLWPLSVLYSAVVRAKAWVYDTGLRKPRRLTADVISVGNLTVGGTGKTPLVLWLAEWLRSRGARAAILTRGYGRRDRKPLVMNGLGDVSRYTPGLMGDEPILFARRVPEATIGIGADRWLLAQQILAFENKNPPQVFLLDDGFQHRQLARDLDIVVLDAADPFGGGALLPAGLLREPLSALGRADLVVIHRAPQDAPEELLQSIRLHNPGAPVFRAWTELVTVCDTQTDREANLFALKQQPAFAFCGIGNPEAFFGDLARWGFQLAGSRAFPDHTRYTEKDVESLRRRAEECSARVLLTTEKDRVNLTGTPPPGLPAFYCRIRMRLDDEERFAAAVLAKLRMEKTSDAAAHS